jgi:hypothetical protein
MSKRNALLGVLFLSSALVVTAVVVFGSRRASGQNTQNGGQNGQNDGNSISRINTKAAVLNNANEAQIRELADEVFKTFDIDQEAPPEITAGLKDRLVRAEVNYRSGRSKPISEFGVVRMTNMLMDKLGAPAYAKTNVFEVRRLEMNFLPYLSKFIGKKPAGTTQSPKALKSSINPTMSPLEAITLSGLLIQQKRFNPAYQLTQDEWVAKHAGNGHKKSTDKSINEFDTKRSDEIEQAIQRGADRLSVAELFKLPHQALDRLGVERTEGGAKQ